MIYLKTERLIIRRVEADDWKSIQKIWADFNQSPMRVYDTPHDTEDTSVQRRIQNGRRFMKARSICFSPSVLKVR